LYGDKKTKICKGYAFVEMVSKDGAEKALKRLTGIEVGGRHKCKIKGEKPVCSTRNYSSNTSHLHFHQAAALKKETPRRPI